MTKKTTTLKTPAADHIADVRKMVATPPPSLFVGQSTTSSTHSGTDASGRPAPHSADHSKAALGQMNGENPVEDALSALLHLKSIGLDDAAAKRAVMVAHARFWGGERWYFERRAGEGRPERNAAIRRDYQRGESLAFLERRYGLCRRQLLRIVQQGV